MSNKFQCLRGMRDLTPDQSWRMQYIEQHLMSIATHYGYRPLSFPILESVDLFKKSIGIETDIVGQEMYTFDDKSEKNIALRPEGTAGCLRSVLANGLIQRQKQKLYYCGPMFRRERPQKGRFRQFTHFGVEVYGYPSGLIDAELILMSHRMWQSLGLDNLALHVNFLGSPASRTKYHKTLADYWLDHKSMLSDDELTRAKNNPLRLLDSKNSDISALIENAPAIIDALTAQERDTYNYILDILDQHEIPYIESNRLVRGLDYYSDFIFEWISSELGAQSTICGGGRYDPLVSKMGHDIPAVGFAAGIDRIESILPEKLLKQAQIYVGFESQKAVSHYMPLLESIRHPNTILLVDYLPGKFKSKMNAAKQGPNDFLLFITDELKLIPLNGSESKTLTFEDFSTWYQKHSGGQHG